MPEFDPEVHLGEGGTFTEQFKTDLPGMLGDDFKGGDMTQFVGDNIATLIKNGCTTKQAYGAKLDNVIQKPGEGATDKQLTEFRSACKAGAGIVVPDTPEGYELTVAEDLAEHYPEESLAKVRAFAHEKGMPQSAVQNMLEYHHGLVREQLQTQEQAHTDGWQKLRTELVGTKLGETLRTVHDALMAFGSDDTKAEDGTVIAGLKTALKEANLYANPDQPDVWRKLGIDVDQIPLWANIGKKMQAGDFATGSNGMTQEQIDRKAHVAAVNAVSAQSPSLQIKE